MKKLAIFLLTNFFASNAAVAQWQSNVVADDFDSNDQYTALTQEGPELFSFNCKAKEIESLEMRLVTTEDYTSETNSSVQLTIEFKLKNHQLIAIPFNISSNTASKIMLVSDLKEHAKVLQVANLLTAAVDTVSYRFAGGNQVSKLNSVGFSKSFKKLQDGCKLPPLPDTIEK
jgi:hypothetical protein